MQLATQTEGSFDLVVVGTSFASSFFLHRYLQHAPPTARVLALERGEVRNHQWQLQNPGALLRESRSSFINQTEKPWVFSLAFGGNSNCWWACTPRFTPEDFRLKTLYGVGDDWPIGYDDLEKHYCDAEEIMSVSGPADGSPYPRSRPYPQPPHRLTDPDRLLKKHFPDLFFNQPTARPSRMVSSSGRPRCCGNGVCALCPINSKFTILNELRHLYDDGRVMLKVGAEVLGLDIANGTASGVRYRESGLEKLARAELVALGANAIFNPYLLLRSGLNDDLVGRGLTEQVAARVSIDLAGVDNFQGSTSITGLGYMLYGGDRRRSRAAAVMESWNVPDLRDERDKWRQRLNLKFIYEDLRQRDNRVTIGADPGRPDVRFAGYSRYTTRALDALDSDLQPILNALPVDRYTIQRPTLQSTEAHIIGTTIMGSDPETSVVDSDLRHHRARNLLVLGSSVFPTTTPANPTLTLCALSLRAADRLFSSTS